MNRSNRYYQEVGSKAVKQSIMNGEKAFKRFFKGQSKFPKFKKKNKSDVKAYFPKNNKTDWTVERHKVKIPTLGFVRLKEYGYIPTNGKVKSGTISMKAGRYYISVLVETNSNDSNIQLKSSEPLGIDLGLKELAVVNNETSHKNINKTARVKKLEKKLKREQRKLSRKYESLKKIGKEGTATRQNIRKQIVKVQKLHQKLANIRTNYINEIVNELVKTNPSYVSIEDLNVKGMMKNKHLSRTVAQQNFYYFRAKLEQKCKENDIELRIVDRWYPSSKTCSCCGYIKKDLKLSDRVYICPDCGLKIDRDLNASYNLRNAKKYKIA